MGWTTIQRLIIDGLLEVRDPRITRESITKFQVSKIQLDVLTPEPARSRSLGEISATSFRQNSSRAKRLWSAVAVKLNITLENVEKLILQGVLKLCDPRVTESSLDIFCQRYGAAINGGFLPKDTREWLRTCMHFDPTAGRELALRLAASREHAITVRICEKCGRSIRGNAFFRHSKRCHLPEQVNRTLLATTGSVG